ncbi:MAG: cobalt ECF transporter T component CbiQ [Thermodesulfovibrio sp.]|nr:cobalt ECF transporter T component CbiQ [Thermodesulfovibrio sp.]
MELFTEYIRKDHLLAEVDARVKIMAAAGLLLMGLSYHGFTFPLLVVALGLVLCFIMQVPLKIFFLRFSEPLFIVVILVLIKLFSAGYEVLFSVNVAGIVLTGYREGLMEGLLLAARILGAVSIVVVLGFATPFTEFIAGLSWFRVPREFVEILLFAYRYIFVLLEEALVIYNAQKIRLGYATVLHGLRAFAVLSGTLTIRAFEHSQDTVIAMANRGYDGNIPLLKHTPFRASEVISASLFLIGMGCLWRWV